MRRTSRLVSITPWLGALALLMALASPTFAAWPHEAFNGNVAVCTASGNQFVPFCLSDGSGGAFVAWYDGRGADIDIYAQHVSATGTPLWSANGVAVCTATGLQTFPALILDGAGGVIVQWQDSRSGNTDLYVQRLNASGVPQWTANGAAVCVQPNEQYNAGCVPDGSGGVILAWQDLRSGTSYDIYAQRISGAGAAQWTANGVAICTDASSQVNTAIAIDGSGGAIMAWQDGRSGNTDLYAQRVNAAGVVQWNANGQVMCQATGEQISPKMAGDGTGGAVIAWQDGRSGNQDIYVQRVSSTGGAELSLTGAAVCTSTGNQTAPICLSDGAGGAIVAWTDARGSNTDLYAQRVTMSGTSLWTANGVALCAASGNQSNPAITTDGAGGAIVTWQDLRNSVTTDVYAQRISGTGAVRWTADGVPICTTPTDQTSLSITPDGSGGAIAAWYDQRGATYDIYAQRVDRYGYLGSVEGDIASVRDVPNDNGGVVKLSWNASYVESEPYNVALTYAIYRSVPPGALAAARARGAHVGALEDAPAASAPGDLFADPAAASGYGWEYLASVTGSWLPAYSYLVPTACDSTGNGNPRTAVMVQTRSGSSHWESQPDSGYSADNLPPASPAAFAGQYAAGASTLHWLPNTDADLAGYRLYRGTSPGFVADGASFVAEVPDTGYVDEAGSAFYYKLVAVDVHGNRSPAVSLLPGGTLGVNDGTLAFALERVSPNPWRGGRLQVAFTLASAGAVRLELLDVAGRRLASRSHMPCGAGRHSAELAPSRPLSPGLYLVRLTQGALTRTARVTVLE